MKEQNNQPEVVTPDFQHKSVLVEEVLNLFNIDPNQPKDATYMDVTFGGGGHSRAILNANNKACVTGFDWDKKSLEIITPRFTEEFGDRVKLFWGNFAHLYKNAKKHNVGKVDGILADFGTSQHQIFNTDGMSFKSKSPLDMRMSKAHSFFTAADVVNTFKEDKLNKILFELGEESQARKITKAILEYRTKKKIEFADQLAKIVVDAKGGLIIPGRTHPATKVFQALRIFVNHELDNIRSLLSAAINQLKPGGRLICISFHSLEDRLVKEFFKEKESLGIVKILTKKPVSGSKEEVAQNPSARSAKLRAIELTELYKTFK